MDSVVKAAADAGPEWLYVVASILVVVTGVLGIVVWYLIKKKSNERDDRIKNLEIEHKVFMGQQATMTERLDARSRQDDILEKRLASGADKFGKIDSEHEKFMLGISEQFKQVSHQMQGLNDAISKVQGFFVDFAREYVRCEQFNRHADEDKELRKELKNQMDEITIRLEEQNRETLGVLKVMEGRLSAMSEILTRREPPVGKDD